MRLHRLVVENWRGIAQRGIDFADGVTLIEGPNEIGKSSLVEALRLLIREYDSSAKQGVKAVQPVGEDVGSSVEAEISTGPYRFTYRKTFNKAKRTELRIIAPGKEQLTGRDAHDRVEQMLEETIDPDLWEALLVDQGEKVAQATLDGSSGLSAALDEAAGGGSSGQEDTALYDAAQAEYEKYFTLKTGRPKFTEQQEAVGEAGQRVDRARQALASVSDDTERYERLAAEVRRRRAELPALADKARELEEKWRAVDAIRAEVKLRRTEFEGRAAELERAREALEMRSALLEKIAESKAAIERLTADLEPHSDTVEACRRDIREAEASIAEQKAGRAAAREHLDRARGDARHLRDREELERTSRLLAELDSIRRDVASSAKLVADIAIDDEGIRMLQDRANQVRVLEGQRDLAATRIEIRTEKDQAVSVADDLLQLEANASLQRTLARRTEIGFPGVAHIVVEPPATATETEAELDEARQAWSALAGQLGVADLDDAHRQLARKKSAAAALEAGKQREKDVLAGKSRAELEHARARLETSTGEYGAARDAEAPIPDSIDAAEERIEAAQQAIDGVDARIGELESVRDRHRKLLDAAEAARREVDDRLKRHAANLDTAESEIAKQRETKTDAALEAQLRSASTAASDAERTLHDAEGRLDALDPDRAETLYRNARQAAERAGREFAGLEKESVVLEDRLKQAQADGRFEAVDEAERALEEAERLYASTRRRADAAERLWQTLNEYRNAARQAYVRPLKEAIERLGRIVFGNDFEVSIADDWSIDTLTRSGRTLPFDALSIGTKEQLGVLTRLAAAQIVADQGGVPLIIDDALGFSDPGRLETMGAAISAAGDACQVIILTCTPDRFSNIGAAKLVRI